MTSDRPTPAGAEDRSVDDLLERHLGDVAGYVRDHLDPALLAKESVSDVVQSICREVLDRKHALCFTDDAAFRAYLYRAAVCKVIDRRRYYLAAKRDMAREVVLQSADGGVPRSVEEEAEVLERFELAFSRLSTDLQEVITLRRVLGHDTAETARRLEISEGQTRKRLARALARLAVLMGD
jgi:RNA polymerase sigma factor (sigma-70 family)